MTEEVKKESEVVEKEETKSTESTENKNPDMDNKGGKGGKKGPKGDGFKDKQTDGFEEEIIQIRRVTRVTSGGRRMRFSVLIVVGDKKGRVGFGMATANELSAAIQKAARQARKRLIAVPIVKNSIPHDIQVKFNSARIHLMPAKEGTGIIAGGAVRRVVELSGIGNIYSKIRGSSNKINNVKAVFKAFEQLTENIDYVGVTPDIEVDLNAKMGSYTTGGKE